MPVSPLCSAEAADIIRLVSDTTPTWRGELRAGREQLRLSRAQLATLADVPANTLRRWEDGTRMPTESRLRRVLDALRLTGEIENGILAGAGYEPRDTFFPTYKFPGYFYSVDELQSEVERVAWPEFVLDNSLGLIAANVSAQALWGIDFLEERGKRARAQMNLLSVASDRKFADRLLNWDACLTVMAGVFKGHPIAPGSLDEPNAYLNAVLAEFAAGDPVFLSRLINAWSSAPELPPKCRWSYPVLWSDAEFGDMRFHAIVSTASEPAGLAFNDWHPSDAETWGVLERVKARRGA